MFETESEINITIFNNNKNEKKEFPFEIKNVEPALDEVLLKDFTGERSGFVQVGPKKWFFPSGYAEQAPDFYNFAVRPSDVWIVTFPRSGTTWTQEMVWLLANNLDYETASKIPLTVRYPFLEFSCFVHPGAKNEFLEENKDSTLNCELINEIAEPLCDYLSKFKGRRFIKTHLPLSLLPKNLLKAGCKVIYVARNPKDVAISFYHLNRLIRTQGYKGDFPTYWNYFTKDLQPWTPYWEHIFEAWNKRNEKNLLFMFYEDMNRNLRGSIEKVQHFLGKNYTNEEIRMLENHLNIENFRKNNSVNFDIMRNLGILVEGEENFVRCGKSGDWTSYFDGNLSKKADEWIEEHLKNTDLRFPSL